MLRLAGQAGGRVDAMVKALLIFPGLYPASGINVTYHTPHNKNIHGTNYFIENFPHHRNHLWAFPHRGIFSENYEGPWAASSFARLKSTTGCVHFKGLLRVVFFFLNKVCATRWKRSNCNLSIKINSIR